MTRFLSALSVCAFLCCAPAFGWTQTNTGTLNELTNIQLGGNTLSGSSDFFNGGNASAGDGSSNHSGAVMNIGDGVSNNATVTLIDANSYFGNYGGNTLNVNAGSALLLMTTTPAPVNLFGSPWFMGSSAALMNWNGGINWSGKIQFAMNNMFYPVSNPGAAYNNANMIMVNNYGTIQVVGQNAVIDRLPNPNGVAYYGTGPQYKEVGPFMNWRTETDGNGTVVAQGRLTGNGKLTYVNSTGSSAEAVMEMGNYGVIAPGAAGAAGTLELDNVELWAGYTGSMQFRLGGTAAGTFDVLTLGGASILDETGTVNISTINGFTPKYGQSWQILNYSSYADYDPNAAPLALAGGYSLEFYPTDAVLTYTPEPATLFLLALGSLATLRRRSLRK